MANLNTRYPGTQSFESFQRDIFFGRDKDIEKLTKMIELEQMVLVYAKSGIGKTSLINAGVLPKLNESKNYIFHKIRFGAWKEGNLLPKEIVAKSFSVFKSKQNYLDKIIYQDNSLWYFVKKWQSQQQNIKNSTLLLILDQFEELFTYPAEKVNELKKDLAELLFTAVPQRFSDQIELLEELKPGFVSVEEGKLLFEQPNVKILFAIRSDKMSELNNMSDYIPRILLKHYELAPLTNEQAMDAIVKPAEMDGNFKSPKFTYHKASLVEIMQFLTKEGKQKDNVESFQLQILCKVVESKVITYNLKEILSDHISPVKDIYQNYYDNLIKGLTLSEEQTLAVRIMIEEGLIEEATRRRLQLSAEQIALQYQVDKEILSLLINERLFRTEERDDYRLYELSHDTLVDPIIASRNIRKEKEEEAQTQQERLKEIKILREKQKKNRRRIALVSIALFLSLLLAGFAFYSMKQAEKAKVEAIISTQKAVIAQEEAEQARHITDSLFVDAEKNNLLLEKNQTELINALKKIKVAQNTTDKIINFLNFNQELLPIRAKNGKYGYIDNNGNLIIDFLYDDAQKFSEGFAAVESNNKYAYIDRNNTFLTPYLFDEAYPFSDGMAKIVKDSLFGYINETGDIITKPQFVKAYDFNNGYAKIAKCYFTYYPILKKGRPTGNLKTMKHWLFGIINKNGNYAVYCQFDSIITTNFSTKIFECIKNNKRYKINGEGVFTNNKNFEKKDYKIFTLSNHSKIVKLKNQEDRFAFINSDYQIISFWFDKVYDFKNGLAKVILDGKFGFVNSKGYLVIDANYDSASEFKDGKAVVVLKSDDYYESLISNRNSIYYINEDGNFLSKYKSSIYSND
jgi:hypothetical protein